MKNIFILIFIALISISTAYAVDKGTFTKNQICKVGIAKVMGRDPSIIKIDRKSEETIYLSYVRQDDQTKWQYKCKLNGNQIVWGSDTGRWRTHAMDSKIHYKIKENLITVTDSFSDGSSSIETYLLENISN